MAYFYSAPLALFYCALDMGPGRSTTGIAEIVVPEVRTNNKSGPIVGSPPQLGGVILHTGTNVSIYGAKSERMKMDKLSNLRTSLREIEAEHQADERGARGAPDRAWGTISKAGIDSERRSLGTRRYSGRGGDE